MIKGLYIYGIVPTFYSTEQFRELENQNLLYIPYGKVSAIVTEETIVDYQDLGTERLARLLVAHQQGIESIMSLGFNIIIPMRLGTFATDELQVKKILEKGHDLILDIFEKIAGFVEVDLVATWADFPKLLGEIAVDKQVLALKSKIQQSEHITQSDQMEIGYLVKKLIDQKKEEFGKKIYIALEPFRQCVKQHEVLNDEMVSNTAFMLNQQQQVLLENALDELDEELNGKLNFKLVGPLPCYSFYTLEVSQLQYDDLMAAKEELEPGEAITEKSVRQAYLKKAKLYHPDQNSDDQDGVKFNNIKQAYHILLSYVQSQHPASDDEPVEISRAKLAEDSFIIKIKNGHV